MRHLAALLLLLAGCPGPNPIDGDGCVACHAGIERVHEAIPEGSCVVCHGGSPDARDQDRAHVPVPEDWAEIRGTALPPAAEGFIRDFAPDQLDALDPAYVRFINPGDIRVLDQTCGVCHPDQARTMPTSVMTTNAGHYWPTLFLAGLQDERIATYASFPANDPDCDPSGLPGSVCSLDTLVPPDDAGIAAALASTEPRAVEQLAYDHYLAKNCNTCHQAGFPRNDSPALYRSTGCTACHMVYDRLGVYRGDDPTIARGSPVHPAKHVLTTAIPTEQCATCHFQGGRIGLLYRGIREGGFGTVPENAEVVDETWYAHTPGYYVLDEDVTNAIDETPPDVHYARGMHCADCHVGSDVHGTGRIWSTSKQQVDIRCEDCHGTVRARIAPDADDVYRTASGRPLPQLSRDHTGAVVLTGRVGGARHVVPQVADLLAAPDAPPGMVHAMGPDDDGWSHTDSLTCDTCHTAYNQTCIGCHVSLDLRLSQVDYQTGERTPGLTRGGRSMYSLDTVLLGTGPDGRVQTATASQQVQMLVLGAERFGTDDGEVLFGGTYTNPDTGAEKLVGAFRDAHGFAANNGFTPFFQHTTSRRPRPCSTCHPTSADPAELARVKGVYGYGTGEFMLPSPDGTLVDGLQFLDADGNPTTAWSHAGTGPVAPEVRARALSVIVDP